MNRATGHKSKTRPASTSRPMLPFPFGSLAGAVTTPTLMFLEEQEAGKPLSSHWGPKSPGQVEKKKRRRTQRRGQQDVPRDGSELQERQRKSLEITPRRRAWGPIQWAGRCKLRAPGCGIRAERPPHCCGPPSELRGWAVPRAGSPVPA